MECSGVLISWIIKEDVENLEKFIKLCINTLYNYAPSKKKYTRGNHLPLVNKELSKAIMNGRRLRNVYLWKRSDENSIPIGGITVLQLLRRTKRKCSLDEKSITDITDNKKFWTTVKPFLWKKSPEYLFI